MPTVNCPRCGRLIQLAASDLHLTIECLSCGQRFTIQDQAPPPVRFPPTDSPTFEDEHPASTGPKAGLLIAVIGGVFLIFFFCAGLLAVVANRHTATPGALSPDATDAVASGSLLGLSMLFWGTICGFFIVYWLLVILGLAWVAKDAKARGMEGALWVIIVLISGILGLLVYLVARPAGLLVACPRCTNRRLHTSRLCPHCGDNSSML